MPYIEHFPFIEKWAPKLGGTSGTLGIQGERTVLPMTMKVSKLELPFVLNRCLESFYGICEKRSQFDGGNYQ